MLLEEAPTINHKSTLPGLNLFLNLSTASLNVRLMTIAISIVFLID